MIMNTIYSPCLPIGKFDFHYNYSYELVQYLANLQAQTNWENNLILHRTLYSLPKTPSYEMIVELRLCHGKPSKLSFETRDKAGLKNLITNFLTI